MASTWQNPTNELTNYTATSNQDVYGLNCNNNAWNGPEDIAWRCNQTDDCDGFITYSGRSGGCMILKSRNGNKGISNGRPVTSNGTTTYSKKSTAWRKAKDPDTTDPSILPIGTGKTKVRLWANMVDQGCQSGTEGGQEWGLTKPGILNPSGGNTALGASTGQTYCNDCVSGYYIPLGWKFIFDQNGVDGGGNVEGYYDRGNQPGCYNMDSPTYHGMNDQMTEGLIQNIGFDVNAHFADMTNNGIDPVDAKQIKLNWCSATNANLDNQNCKNFFADTTPSGAGMSWYATKLALCDGQGGHASPNDSSCVNAINNVQKSTAVVDGVSQGTATALVQTYCDANPNDALCGCYNVTKYNTQCISDSTKQNLPGCENLNSDFGRLPNYASVIAADKFCASSDCITSALSSSTAFMPVARSPQQACPTIQACIQDFRNANFSGASLSTNCKNTLNISTAPPPPPGTPPPPPGTPPPPPGAVGAGPPPTGTPPSGTPVTQGSDGSTLPITNPTVANVLDTKTKQYGAIGGGVFIILCCCCLLVLMMSGGGDGGGGGASTAALLASLGSAGD